MHHLEQISTRIASLDAERVLICIDGPAGAGKTTLAAELESVLVDAQVIHMDSLYDGWDAALSPELAQRLTTQIRDPHLAGEPVAFAAYDWSKGQFGAIIEVPATRVLIVEGVGAAQASMRERAHLSVFVTVGHDRGRQRVVDRDGDASIGHIDAWQVMEAAHFAADATVVNADIVIDGDEF